MEQLERIGKLKESEKKILSDIYAIILYIAMALIVFAIILAGVHDPFATIITSVIAALIYTLALIYFNRSGSCIWNYSCQA